MKRSHIAELSMEITVGAFMFMILLALAFFTIILSYENIFTTYHHIDVKFEHVRGLRQGDNVFIRGVMVGRVKSLTVEEDGVRVLASLETEPKLREGYRIEILASSVLGGNYLSIYEGPADAPPLPKDTPLRGSPPVDLMAEATATVKSIREALEEGEILSNLQNTMAGLSKVTEDLSEGRGTLGKLMVDESVYNNLVEITASLKDVSGALERGEGTIGKLMTDEAVYDDLRRITENLAGISDRLAAGEGMMGKMLSDDSTLYEDLSATASSLRSITEAIASGEGTIGKLAMDDEIYEEAKLLLHELRATIDDIRETAPITTFTSIFFGAF